MTVRWCRCSCFSYISTCYGPDPVTFMRACRRGELMAWLIVLCAYIGSRVSTFFLLLVFCVDYLIDAKKKRKEKFNAGCCCQASWGGVRVAVVSFV